MYQMVKKAGKILCSMKCAIVLLLILALACTTGSFIPQGKETIYYIENYQEQISGAILLLGLNDVFHCGWFIALTLFLCANLLCCNVLRFSGIMHRFRTGYTLEKALKSWDGHAAGTVQSPELLFHHMGFRKFWKEETDGRACVYSVRNRAGLWGAWLCHLGMLIIIAGFGLGQLYQSEYTVYGVPGQTKPIGDQGYELTIDNFEIELREDDTVEQYTADITVVDTNSGSRKSGTICVNQPVTLFGMKFYQNSTGWAASVTVCRAEEQIQ